MLFRIVPMAVCLAVCCFNAAQAASPRIDTASFRDCAHHWRKIRDKNRFIQPLPDQTQYEEEQIAEIAANILLFQRNNGGWPKDYDMRAVLTDPQRQQVAATRDREDTSFDNHNTFSQVEYLARAYTITNDETLREACVRGLDFMLAAQQPGGGIPQWYPRGKGYHGQITFNDGAMIGVLRVLKAAADGAPHFSWLDQAQRQQAAAAVDRGIDCILKCQIAVDGRLTGWCQQHDRETYAATSARTFELASICPQDTTEIVRFLMSVKPSRPEIVRAVDAAVDWLDDVPLAQTSVRRVKTEKTEFIRHTADFDVIVETDPDAPPIWARHYEIGTNRPIFAGRDGMKKYRLADVERERRTGSVWYGSWPQRLIADEYPAWRKQTAALRDSVSQ